MFFKLINGKILLGDKMIDTHAHINLKPLINDVQTIIKNAKEYNVNKILCVGINKKTNEIAVNLANQYSEVYASVGYHPSEVKETLDLGLLEKQLSFDKVVALGEIGIDLHWTKDNLERQKEVFLNQIDLAIKLKMPVIIHSRNSAEIIYQLIKNKKGLSGVMHCYSEHEELLDKFIQLGLYIGVGGIVTFKNANLVKNIARSIPLERILIETDSPYLAPAPFRGKINEPKNVSYVLKELSLLLNISEEQLKEITTNNAKRLFYKLK